MSYAHKSYAHNWLRWGRGAAFSLWVAALLAGISACGDEPDPPATAPVIRVGYLVKQPDGPWYELEWKAAQKCADDNGFELSRIPVQDDQQLQAAMATMVANHVLGFVISAPDARAGEEIARWAQQTGIRVMTVDDVLLGADGKALPNVHHISPQQRAVGHSAGDAEIAEMTKRGWKAAETGACVISLDENMDTEMQRIAGAQEALLAGGMTRESLFVAHGTTSSVDAGQAAAESCMALHHGVKNWLIVGASDGAVMCGVRAAELRGIAADHVIGIGIGGVDCKDELAKSPPTGFVGSILLNPEMIGKQATLLMYNWVKSGIEPRAVTVVKTGTLMTRENYAAVLKEAGLE